MVARIKSMSAACNHYVAYTFKKYCLFVKEIKSTFPLKALIFPDQMDIKELCYVDVFL